MIQIKNFVFNPFLENTYVVYDESKECLIIDPGCYEDYEKSKLSGFIAKNDLKVVRLLNTHCHIDHVFGNEYIKTKYRVNLSIHKEDEAVLRAVKVYAPNYGFQHYEESFADNYLKEGDRITFGNSHLEVIHVPGHAPGHIALVNKEEKCCISGDVLFRGSIGRTDLPGGDHRTLIDSIRTKLFALSDDVAVHCGHGYATTIGYEKANNPYCGLTQ